jgi:hypothetical protein
LNFAYSMTTIVELRRYLRDESVDAFAEVPGLRFKAWISDEATERWGAVYLWESAEAASAELPSRARELIGDDRFTEIGYRSEGVFLGERDHNHDPLPEFIGARPQDVPDIMTGLNECNNRLRTSDVDPVLQATAIAFGFVYVHPLADGNGRLHRCLIHHVLAERKYTPPGMVFPVSSVMLDRIDDYAMTLKRHSGPLMEFIDWRALPNHNVEVTNETADLYRYFDCTEEAEFLYSCVQRTVEIDLPREIDYLKCRDQALTAVMNLVEMPDRMAQDLIMHIRQNGGSLSKRRRTGEFEKLRDDEVQRIEAIVADAFEGVLGRGFEERPGLLVTERWRGPLVVVRFRALDALDRMEQDGVFLTEVLIQRGQGRELAADGRRRERGGRP